MSLRETCPLVRWREGCNCGWILSCIRAVAGTCFPPISDQVPLHHEELIPFPGGSCRCQEVARQVLLSLAVVSAARWAVPPWQCFGGCPSAWPSLTLSLTVTIKQTRLRGFGPNKSHPTLCPVYCVGFGCGSVERCRGCCGVTQGPTQPGVEEMGFQLYEKHTEITEPEGAQQGERENISS